VAIKLESVRSKHPQLLYESRVLRCVPDTGGHTLATLLGAGPLTAWAKHREERIAPTAGQAIRGRAHLSPADAGR